jgi:hypothetical protein
VQWSSSWKIDYNETVSMETIFSSDHLDCVLSGFTREMGMRSSCPDISRKYFDLQYPA